MGSLFLLAQKMGCEIFHPGDRLFVDDVSVWNGAICVRRPGDAACSWIIKEGIEAGEEDVAKVDEANCSGGPRPSDIANPCSWGGALAERFAFHQALAAWRLAALYCEDHDDNDHRQVCRRGGPGAWNACLYRNHLDLGASEEASQVCKEERAAFSAANAAAETGHYNVDTFWEELATLYQKSRRLP